MPENKTENIDSLKENVSQEILKDQEPENDCKSNLDQKELLDKIDYLDDQLKRTLADFSNYKKRIEKESVQNIFLENSKIILEFLYFKEILEKAIEHEMDNTFKKNIIELNNNFENILKRLDIKKINLLNTEYDYNLAECIQTMKTDDKDNNKVVSVLENGYTFKEKLIKPGKVIIGKFTEE